MIEWLLGPIAGLAGSLGAGLLGKSAQESANEANAVAAQKNIEMQEKFAKQGVRWKVEDAKAAGLHPLYALGANTPSFSPVSVGAAPVDAMATMAHNMGQDLSRAAYATKTDLERKMQNMQLASLEMDIQGKAIDNQIRASQLQKLSQVGPAFPNGDNFIPGQGDSNLVKVKPSERTASQPGRLAQEAGWRPDVSYSRTDTGLTPMVPESLSESLEDDIVGKVMWRMRNQLIPNFTGTGAPAKSQLPKGYDFWDWNHLKQEWQPKRNSERSRLKEFFYNHYR